MKPSNKIITDYDFDSDLMHHPHYKEKLKAFLVSYLPYGLNKDEIAVFHYGGFKINLTPLVKDFTEMFISGEFDEIDKSIMFELFNLDSLMS